MDNTTLILAAVFVLYVSKDKLKAGLVALKGLSKKEDRAVKAVLHLEGELASDHAAVIAEVNHVKGQLQEAMQASKTLAEANLALVEQVIKLNNSTSNIAEQAVMQQLAVAAIQSRLEVPVDNSVYLESLTALAQASNKVLERQEKNEKILISIIERLNALGA